jgi:nitric oxide reductase subunit B
MTQAEMAALTHHGGRIDAAWARWVRPWTLAAWSMLPIGILQFHASVSEGLWWARSEAFMQQPLLETLRWVRTFGDVVFIVGAVAMAWQVVSGVRGTSAASHTSSTVIPAK